MNKTRNDLCIYKTVELEHTFIALISKKSSVIIGAINWHPKMDLDELMTFTLILYYIRSQRKTDQFFCLVTFT